MLCKTFASLESHAVIVVISDQFHRLLCKFTGELSHSNKGKCRSWSNSMAIDMTLKYVEEYVPYELLFVEELLLFLCALLYS